MSQSFPTLPMRVAVQNRHRKPAGYHFRVGTRAGGRDDRNTLCGPGLPPIENLPANPSAVSHALTPLGGGNWRRAIERTQTHVLALRRFISRGPLLICNLRGGFKALRSLLLRSLVPLRQEPTSGSLKCLFLAPAFLSVPVLHANNKAWSSQHDAQRNPASRASGASSYE